MDEILFISQHYKYGDSAMMTTTTTSVTYLQLQTKTL